MPRYCIASIDGHSRYKNFHFDQSLRNLKALHHEKYIIVSDTKVVWYLHCIRGTGCNFLKRFLHQVAVLKILSECKSTTLLLK